MKTSLVTSAALHALVLFWALFSWGGPHTMEVADVEALPVDIVPVESITQIQKGDKKAPAKDVSAPKPTSRPDPVKDAEEIGDNMVDLKTPPTPKESPKPVEAAAPPKQSENPKPAVDDKPVPKPDMQEAKPEPAPAPEVAALPKETPPAPEPKQEEPAPQAAQPEPSEAPEFASLPESVPTPAARPQPPQPAKAPEPKKPDIPVETAKKREKKEEPKPKETAEASSAKKSEFDADKIAALLNREDPSGGGAKRSTQEAALGGTKTTAGDKLTQSEMDALRAQIEKNWNIIPGMADGQDVRIQVTMRLDPSGAIVGEPQVSASGGSDSTRRTLAGSARRAVLMSSPFQGLPAEKYQAWSEVVVNFDPSQMY